MFKYNPKNPRNVNEYKIILEELFAKKDNFENSNKKEENKIIADNFIIGKKNTENIKEFIKII